MAILKDSRIGVYGALALIVSVALRWQSLLSSQANVALGLAVSLAVSRSSLVLLAFFVPFVGEGLGASFVRFLSAKVVVAVLAQALFFAAFCGWRVYTSCGGLAVLTVIALEQRTKPLKL